MVRSIMLGLLCEEGPLPIHAMKFAVDLAADQGAHLTAGVGAPTFDVTPGMMLPEVRWMAVEANKRRAERAKEIDEHVRHIASLAGVSVKSELVHNNYPTLRGRLVRLARASDLAVLTRSQEISSLEQDLVEEVLFSSGRPVLLVPDRGDLAVKFAKVVLAWDGSARAARAMGDALPLLGKDTAVEVVSVAGDPNPSKAIEGLEMAEHLSRHIPNVSVAELPALDGNVAATIRNHMTLTKADLLIMGGYAHSRLREMVLGGVTREMLSSAAFPVLLSY